MGSRPSGSCGATCRITNRASAASCESSRRAMRRMQSRAMLCTPAYAPHTPASALSISLGALLETKPSALCVPAPVTYPAVTARTCTSVSHCFSKASSCGVNAASRARRR